MEQLLQDLMQVIKKHSPQTEIEKENPLADPKFKVGDEVVTNRFEGTPNFISAMEDFVGKIGVIQKAYNRKDGNIYVVHGCGWSESALTLVDEEWKPLTGSIIEVSDRNIEWHKAEFIGICPVSKMFIACAETAAKTGLWKYCRPLQAEAKKVKYNVWKGTWQNHLITWEEEFGTIHGYELIHSFEI